MSGVSYEFHRELNAELQQRFLGRAITPAVIADVQETVNDAFRRVRSSGDVLVDEHLRELVGAYAYQAGVDRIDIVPVLGETMKGLPVIEQTESAPLGEDTQQPISEAVPVLLTDHSDSMTENMARGLKLVEEAFRMHDADCGFDVPEEGVTHFITVRRADGQVIYYEIKRSLTDAAAELKAQILADREQTAEDDL